MVTYSTTVLASSEPIVNRTGTRLRTWIEIPSRTRVSLAGACLTPSATLGSTATSERPFRVRWAGGPCDLVGCRVTRAAQRTGPVCSHPLRTRLGSKLTVSKAQKVLDDSTAMLVNLLYTVFDMAGLSQARPIGLGGARAAGTYQNGNALKPV